MLMKRGLLSWGVAVLLTFATAALAEPPPEELASREPEPTEESLCPGSFCFDDSQCSCNTGRGYCGPNGTCVY